MNSTPSASPRSVVAMISVAWLAILGPIPQSLGSDAPYGMDASPQSVFYEGAGGSYSADPVPLSRGEHNPSPLGREVIPAEWIPHLRDLHRVLPHPTLQVLTRAIEDDHARRAASR